MVDLTLRENHGTRDTILLPPMPELHRSGIYQRTSIMGGYDYRRDINGISSLGEVTFTTQNMIPIGACQYSFEQLFGVTGPLTVPTLYEISNSTIGLPNVSVLNYKAKGETVQYAIPHKSGDTETKEIIHPLGEYVCLFGIGITGSATNVLTKPPVDYKEYAIQNSLAVEDGGQMKGVMIPFRHTANKLSDADAVKYFGKTAKWSSSTADPISYYLKKFEHDPEIKHFWKAADDETESTNEVQQTEYYPRNNTVNSGTIESYTEIVLQITPKDVKEWFDATDNIDHSRINTIALFTGRYNKEQDDYENVRLFSKLCFNVTSLNLTKDFTVIYRVYSS